MSRETVLRVGWPLQRIVRRFNLPDQSHTVLRPTRQQHQAILQMPPQERNRGPPRKQPFFLTLRGLKENGQRPRGCLRLRPPPAETSARTTPSGVASLFLYAWVCGTPSAAIGTVPRRL